MHQPVWARAYEQPGFWRWRVGRIGDEWFLVLHGMASIPTPLKSALLGNNGIPNFDSLTTPSALVFDEVLSASFCSVGDGISLSLAAGTHGSGTARRACVGHSCHAGAPTAMPVQRRKADEDEKAARLPLHLPKMNQQGII